VRVALVCPYSWTAHGGVQSHVRGLARALARQGVESDILAPAEHPRAAPEIVVLGRPVVIRSNGSHVPVALGPSSIWRTAGRVRSGDYDVVHLHEPMIPAACVTALVAARVPLVATFHKYGEGPGWYRPFGPLCRTLAARLSVRLAVSEAARRHAARTCPGEYEIVPNGLDTARFARLPGPRGEGRVVFVGRPDRRKGLPVLLRAVAGLPEARRVDLVGVTQHELVRAANGVPRGELDAVHAYGRVSDAVRDRLLARADVLCAPALEGESFGLVLLEAMAAGVPVVASRVAGYADLMGSDVGLLVPPGDPGALRAALRRALGDADLRARMGAAGRRHAHAFDWDRVAARVIGAYRVALGAPGDPLHSLAA
jgi:phosphatidylinositol alpha-mannosyltransferase